MNTSKIVDAVSDWVLADPAAVAKVREAMRPHLQQAWEDGYFAGRDDEAEGRSHRDPHRTPNPYKETA